MTDWVNRLTDWYEANKRALPWREDPSPYRVWISEVMAQQTRIETVIPYYRKFLRAHPTVEDLARADLQEILKNWEGLGYYSRARNLHAAARMVADRFDGELPRTADRLQELPGVGPYTSAAVASIAFQEPVPVVDGNVLRVFTRFWGIEKDVRKNSTKRALAARLAPFVQESSPATFNQAIMELGALVCKPRNPDCPSCPLSDDCVARRENRIEELPYKAPRGRVPHHDVAVGIARKGERILIGRRRTDQMLGGLWELPGGKKQKDEELPETVVREFKEETNLTVTVGDRLCTVRHAYSHFRITMAVFDCIAVEGTLKARSADELKWVAPESLDDYPFPTATRKVFKTLGWG